MKSLSPNQIIVAGAVTWLALMAVLLFVVNPFVAATGAPYFIQFIVSFVGGVGIGWFTGSYFSDKYYEARYRDLYK